MNKHRDLPNRTPDYTHITNTGKTLEFYFHEGVVWNSSMYSIYPIRFNNEDVCLDFFDYEDELTWITFEHTICLAYLRWYAITYYKYDTTQVA